MYYPWDFKKIDQLNCEAFNGLYGKHGDAGVFGSRQL